LFICSNWDFFIDHSTHDDDAQTDYENLNQQRFLSQLTNFMHAAQLNKTNSSSLLSLLRSTCSFTIDSIPRTTDALWQELGIAFTFKTFYYCSICFTELTRYQDSCSICNLKEKANSELCIFSISDEIERVVQSNIDLIQWYSSPEHQIAADIVNGKSNWIEFSAKYESVLFIFR
jgi:hypothetical protein